MPSEQQRQVLKEVTAVLQPMAEAQRMLEGDKYSTSSITPAAIWKIRKELKFFATSDNVTSAAKHLATVMLEDFENKRYGNGEQVYHEQIQIGKMNRYVSLHRIILVAAALDPQMKHFTPFASEDDKIKTYEYVLQLMIEQANIQFDNVEQRQLQVGNTEIIHQDQNPMHFFAEVQQASAAAQAASEGIGNEDEVCSAKLNRYKCLSPLEMHGNPLQWWEEHSNKLPILYTLAMKYLCIPAISAPSERLWSIAARVITNDRARIDPEVVACIIFLKVNGQYLNKHQMTIDGMERVLPCVYAED